MASLDIEIQDLKTNRFVANSAQTYVEIRDGEAAAKTGVIEPIGVLDLRPAVAGTLTQWFGRDISSDVGGYRKLHSPAFLGIYVTRTVTFSGSPIPTGEQTISDYATGSSLMAGVSSNSSTTSASLRARKVTGGTQVCKVRLEVYHRTAAGVETLLDSFTTPDLTGTFTQYTSGVTINRQWADGERLVMKAIGLNLGIPP